MAGTGVTFIFQNSDMSKHQAKNVWAGLQRGIQEIQNGNASTLRFEELYRNAYTLVLHKHGELLYDGVEKTISSKLQETAAEVSKTTDNQLISVIVKAWNNHKLIMTMIRDILMYMDKTYCEIKNKMISYDLGISLFKLIVIMNGNVLIRLRSQILLNIYRERKNSQIDQSLIRNCLRMFLSLDASLYSIEFEKYFIRSTREFYQIESEIYITSLTVPEYLQLVDNNLSSELSRCDSYIPSTYTRNLLISTVEYELISRYLPQLINNKHTGCINLFNKNSINDLHLMYNLFNRSDPKNQLLRESMYKYITSFGESILQQQQQSNNNSTTTNSAEKFVDEVLKLLIKFQNIVSKSFGNNRDFIRKLKESFEYFINLDIRCSQYLSLYTDILLRRHITKLTESEIFNKLDNVIIIFKYLSDKDIFEDFYKQHLAARLLHTKSYSDNYEKLMISKLKTECGHQYTSKLEGMFKDISQSRQLNETWCKLYGNNTDDDVPQLQCKVLTTGFWPIPSQKRGCKLPLLLLTECSKYRKFYCNSHNGRKLVFDTSLGTSELRVIFNDNSIKDIVCHTYQMCILLLYNQRNTYTWLEIQNILQINPVELKKHILALAHPKIKILNKKPNKKLLNNNDTFTFNNKYTNQRVRINIGILDNQKKKNQTTSFETNKNKSNNVPHQVLETRKNRVEASIVRIMKARKKLNHQQLIVQVVHQLQSRFNPNPQFIKQRISSLIEREYLERDNKDRRLYHYLA